MATYTIESKVSGAVLGTYEGESVADALDSYAAEAGYENFADLLARVPGASRDELVVVSEEA